MQLRTLLGVVALLLWSIIMGASGFVIGRSTAMSPAAQATPATAPTAAPAPTPPVAPPGIGLRDDDVLSGMEGIAQRPATALANGTPRRMWTWNGCEIELLGPPQALTKATMMLAVGNADEQTMAVGCALRFIGNAAPDRFRGTDIGHHMATALRSTDPIAVPAGRNELVFSAMPQLGILTISVQETGVFAAEHAGR